jgi:hypothetical protein
VRGRTPTTWLASCEQRPIKEATSNDEVRLCVVRGRNFECQVACVPQEGGIGKEKRGHALFRKMHFQPKFRLKMGISARVGLFVSGRWAGI